MKELRELAAAVVRHIRETLQAAHSHDTHREMLESLRDVEHALEQKDESDGLRELVALSEALDMTIADEDVGKGVADVDDDVDTQGDEDDGDDDDRDLNT
jgi:hypothetical protein